MNGQEPRGARDPREPRDLRSPSSEERRRRDPTSMSNQPALQTSTGRIWLVMGGLFAALSMIPLVALAAGGGPSMPLAVTTIAAVIVLYAAMIAIRFTVEQRQRRLWWMAACMLMMAAVALIGVWSSAIAEAA